MRNLTPAAARKMAAQRKTHGAGPGRPKGSLSGKPRYACRAMTRDRARKRQHVRG